jgi:hypothetical protein
MGPRHELLNCIGLAITLAACDPVRSANGRVMSADEMERRPVQNVAVTEVCKEFKAFLTKTDDTGRFSVGGIGLWNKECQLVFEDDDGAHETKTVPIKDVCSNDCAGTMCHTIKDLEVELRRTGEPKPPVVVKFRSDPAGLELWATDEQSRGGMLCASPCEERTKVGHRLLEVREHGATRPIWQSHERIMADTKIDARFRRPEGRQTAATWMILPFLAGAITLPVGLVRDDDLVTGVGTGLMLGGIVGFVVVWAPDDVTVTVKPLTKSNSQ